MLLPYATNIIAVVCLSVYPCPVLAA